MKQTGGCLGYIRDETTVSSYIGIRINHHIYGPLMNNQYFMESIRDPVFFFFSRLNPGESHATGVFVGVATKRSSKPSEPKLIGAATASSRSVFTSNGLGHEEVGLEKTYP